MQDEGYSVGEVAALLKRRLRLIVITFITISLLSIVIAFSLETLYRSSGEIVIEQPEVANQFIPGTYQAPDREQRIDRINDEVMTRDNLAKIVDKHNLYAEKRKGGGPESVVPELRDNFELRLKLADDNPRRKYVGDVMGFVLAFYHPDPDKSRDVASDIVNLFIEGNRKRRQQAYVETSEALASEAEDLRITVSRLESELADFKTEHPGALPEDRNFNRQVIERKSRDLTQLDREIRSLQERKTLLQSQLAQTDLWVSTIGPDGEPLPASTDQLQQLQSEYLRLLGIYSANHPDVVRIRREIDSLTGGAANPAFRQALEAEYTAKQIALSDALNQYAENHPDVIQLRRSIAAIQDQLDRIPEGRSDLPPPNNPTYINLQLQLQGLEIELAALQEDRRKLQTETTELDEKFQIAPEVERRYLELSRDLTIARNQYEDTMSRRMAIERAETFEELELSERYVVTRLPRASYTPAFPNRPLIIIIGVFLGATIGVGLGILAEVLDDSIRNTRDIRSFMGAPPVAAIPNILTTSEAQLLRRNRLLVICAFGVAMGIVAVYVQLQRTGAI